MVSTTSTKGRNTTSKETANNKSSSSERRPPYSACRSPQVMCKPNNQEVSGESELEHVLFWWFKHSKQRGTDHGKRCEFPSLYCWFILEFLCRERFTELVRPPMESSNERRKPGEISKGSC